MEPQVKGRKILVRFKSGSICGTDLNLYRGEWKIKRGRIIGSTPAESVRVIFQEH